MGVGEARVGGDGHGDEHDQPIGAVQQAELARRLASTLAHERADAAALGFVAVATVRIRARRDGLLERLEVRSALRSRWRPQPPARPIGPVRRRPPRAEAGGHEAA